MGNDNIAPKLGRIDLKTSSMLKLKNKRKHMIDEKIVHKFYRAFAEGDAEQMVSFYHEKAHFEDPIFGKLNAQQVANMWRMLIARRDKNTQITHKITGVNGGIIKVNWIAQYNYGPKKRKVVNHVSAQLKIVDGRIMEHTDHFDLWKWTQQAFGLPGYLLGWSSFMKMKIKGKVSLALKEFIES